ncbi:PA2169 family four-helix-bundle protein [Niabella beijingensis]|uniref:PA2169 family four-helix-bundle protein n=1 Tax=Niabella beijingensis TaxID=2872700 RepID=UPI001CBCD1E2|nr:PA2169 family four-helix-bundle protein [Niabella beijingensis]MBZ4190942.1 PA2169 family four-helix-bundle protein [Niabella beijingensis]
MRSSGNSIKNRGLLSDLIKINADRIRIYENIKELCTGNYLAEFFEELIAEGCSFITVLRRCIEQEAPEHASAFVKGYLYNIWTSLRYTYRCSGALTLLAACEYSENAALRAYEIVLTEYEISEELETLLQQQQEKIQNTRDRIKRIRSFIGEQPPC